MMERTLIIRPLILQILNQVSSLPILLHYEHFQQQCSQFHCNFPTYYIITIKKLTPELLLPFS